MYRESDIHDPRRNQLEQTFTFLHEDARITRYQLCDGYIADLLGAFTEQSANRLSYRFSRMCL